MKKIVWLLLLVIVVVGVLGFFYSQKIQKKVFISSSNTKTASGLNWLEDHLKNRTPFGILLLGYGGGNHDGGTLTDTMLLARFDPSLKTIYLISIPRDLWVKLSTGYSKINSAYPISSSESKQIVQTVTGLSVDRYVTLDFAGFTQAIDILGGIDIKVEKTFDDPEYPVDGKENDLCGHAPADLAALVAASATDSASVFPCRYETLHFDAGIQHMDGATALKFVRSRHSLQDGTDFGRSTRQRNLLIAVRQKIITPSFLPKLISFVNSLSDHITTDIDPDTLQVVLSHRDELTGYTIKSLALSDQNLLVDSTSPDNQDILLPSSGQDRYDAIHSWLANQTSPNPKNSVPVIIVENGTSLPNIAEQATNLLKTQNYKVLPPINYLDQSQDKTFIQITDPTVDPQIINHLKDYFGSQLSVQTLTPSTPPTYDVLVVLGKDYPYAHPTN